MTKRILADQLAFQSAMSIAADTLRTEVAGLDPSLHAVKATPLIPRRSLQADSSERTFDNRLLCDWNERCGQHVSRLCGPDDKTFSGPLTKSRVTLAEISFLAYECPPWVSVQASGLEQSPPKPSQSLSE